MVLVQHVEPICILFCSIGWLRKPNFYTKYDLGLFWAQKCGLKVPHTYFCGYKCLQQTLVVFVQPVEQILYVLVLLDGQEGLISIKNGDLGHL